MQQQQQQQTHQQQNYGIPQQYTPSQTGFLGMQPIRLFDTSQVCSHCLHCFTVVMFLQAAKGSKFQQCMFQGGKSLEFWA